MNMKRIFLLLSLSAVFGCNSHTQAESKLEPAVVGNKADQQKILLVIKQQMSLSRLTLSKSAFIRSPTITIDSPSVNLSNGIVADTRTATSTKVRLLKRGTNCFLTFNQDKSILVEGLECKSSTN